MRVASCVHPEGRFVWGLHRPAYTVANLRDTEAIYPLGRTLDGRPCYNHANFPAGDVAVPRAEAVFEIANPFPFRGTTYIGKAWADKTAADPQRIGIRTVPRASLSQALRRTLGDTADARQIAQMIRDLPPSIRLATATSSCDPEDLIPLAHVSCNFICDDRSGRPAGLEYVADGSGRPRPVIHDERLFDAVANNPDLPDEYKIAMVLRPGVQGDSAIVGEVRSGDSHVYEYLRRNSYIPWGHYAANMAHDAVRYCAGRLTATDVNGMRHLYYQRTYVRLAGLLNPHLPTGHKTLSVEELEALRLAIRDQLTRKPALPFSATLWGWNYGYDYAPSGFRLHASHQQIHQQFALIPERVPDPGDPRGDLPTFAFGDLVQDFMQQYKKDTGRDFFSCYRAAIADNRRLDGRTHAPRSLVIYEDDQVMLFVPKAQTSQWELLLMAVPPVGHIIEADRALRDALDRGLLTAMHILTGLGATMITVFEASKRFTISEPNQHLFYTFLPRLPESPGAFAESQLRWINGHYPEDFAEACRLKLAEL